MTVYVARSPTAAVNVAYGFGSVAVWFILLHFIPNVQKVFTLQTWSELWYILIQTEIESFIQVLGQTFTSQDILSLVLLGAFFLIWRVTWRASENGRFQDYQPIHQNRWCVCFAGEDSNAIQTVIHCGREVVHWSRRGDRVPTCTHTGSPVAPQWDICNFYSLRIANIFFQKV